MLQFRKNIIDKILQSPEVNSIEPIIRNPLKKLIENGTHLHYVARFRERLVGDLTFELRQQHNEKEQNNLREALRVLHEKELQKSK